MVTLPRLFFDYLESILSAPNGYGVFSIKENILLINLSLVWLQKVSNKIRMRKVYNEKLSIMCLNQPPSIYLVMAPSLFST